MNRLRARFLALVVPGFFSVAAGAASIPVTTQFDIVADNDNLCSIREAVAASVLATDISARNSGQTQLETQREQLQKVFDDMQVAPGTIVVPKTDMLTHVNAMITAVDAVIADNLAYDMASRDPGLVAEAAALKTALTDFDTLVKAALSADVLIVEDGIALQDRTIALLGKLLVHLDGMAAADGCSDGTSFDTVQLEANKTYYLRSPIVLDARLTLRGAENAVIAHCREVNPADTTADKCQGGAGIPARSRLLTILAGSSVEIYQLTFRGGGDDAAAVALGGAATISGGGAIEVSSSLTMEAVRFVNNAAIRGGAIAVTNNGSMTLTDVQFIGNAASTDGGAIDAGGSIQMTGITFGRATAGEGNFAGDRGGAVYVSGLAGLGMGITNSSIIGNSADSGAAIYVGGPDPSLSLSNVTIARNHALVRAALAIAVTGPGVVRMNNVTLIENDAAGAGTAGISLDNLITLQIANSVVAGNISTGGGPRPDCDFGLLTLPAGDFRRNLYGNPPAGGPVDACPGARWPSSVPERENFELLQGAVQYNLVANGGAATPANSMLLDLDVAAGYYTPVFPDDVNDGNENRLVNRGAGALDEMRCTDKDQRDLDRVSSVDSECDIGAVEYQVGRREDDDIELLVDETRCINVVLNDIGDALYVPGTLSVLGVERAGTLARVLFRDLDGAGPLVDEISQCPNAAEINAADPAGRYDVILFRAAPGFRGEVGVTYGLEWETRSVGSPIRDSVTGVARIQTESRGGITSSSISVGVFQPLVLVSLALLALRRRQRAGLYAAAMAALMAAFPAQAVDNIIYVNSGLDEPLGTTPSDGRCTLREALATARNDQANLSGGDCINGNEGPDIIEFSPSFVGGGPLTVLLNDTVVGYGNVTIRCPEAAAGATAPQCAIQRNPAATNRFRLIDSRGSLSIQRLILEGGLTPDTGVDADGGAIFSTGTVSLTNSIVRNNSAVSGGGIFLAGDASSLTISNSLFENNRSRDSGTGVGNGRGGGGAVATSQGNSHKIKIIASTFINNGSVAGAGALDLNSRASVVVANSTFSGNRSTRGPGVIDVSGVTAVPVLRNLTIVGNLSGRALQHDSWESTLVPLPALPVQRAAIQTGNAAATLTSNIIGANFQVPRQLDEDPLLPAIDPLVGANCGPMAPTVARRHNLFGDDDGVGSATSGYTCDVSGFAVTGDDLVPASTVYDGGAAATTALLTGLVDSIVALPAGKLPMHVLNPATTADQSLLVDAGFDVGANGEKTQLDAGFESGLECAAVDQRDVSRLSGLHCDRGAYEVLGITATDDRASNGGRADRLVVIDVLANDVFDDISAVPAYRFKSDCTVVDDATPGLVTWEDAGGAPCITITDDAADGVDLDRDLRGRVTFVTPASVDSDSTSPYLVQFDNRGYLRNDTHSGDPDAVRTVPKKFVGPIKLTYLIYTAGGAASNTADIQVSIDNVPPQANDDTVQVGLSDSVTVNVLANDNDDDPQPLAGGGLSRISIKDISGTGCSPQLDPLGVPVLWRCEFGDVTVDKVAGTISWSPRNTFNQFRQVVTYELTDNDPVFPKTATGTLTIVVDRNNGNGGAIFGEDDLSDILGINFLGAPGPLFFVLVVLAALRRRQVH